jgi:hypothetical protein
MAHFAPFALDVACERSLFHPAVNASFLEGFQGSGLSVSQSWFSMALRKNPASFTGLHQKEFDVAASAAKANGGDLFAPA